MLAFNFVLIHELGYWIVRRQECQQPSNSDCSAGWFAGNVLITCFRNLKKRFLVRFFKLMVQGFAFLYHIKLLTVKCFGNFEVYAKNEKLMFKRLKTKELFAFLVDRNGAGMTAKQICAVLFPDDTDDTKNAAYLRQLVLDLKNTLKSVGAEAVLCHETPCYRVDTGLIKCDYVSYLESGKPEFHGEYMMQYSWAEDTCAMLE